MRLPLDRSERKKVIALIVLVAVGAVVVGGQLWSKKGPAAAEAASPLMATSSIDLEGLIKQIRQDDTPVATTAAGSKPLFRNIDEALDVFLDGAKAPAVPLNQLRHPIFGVPEECRRVAAPVAPPEPAPAPAAGPPSPEAKKEDPAQAELAKLNLETVLVSSRNQAAIINGQVLHTGEMISGFQIVTITQGLVALERDGQKYELALK
jgi:hypothetical protein